METLFGFLGLITACATYFKKEYNKMLIISGLSYVFFGIQYLVIALNGDATAWNGMYIMAVCLLRNIFYRYSKIENKHISNISIFLMCVLSSFGYNGLMSILPTIAMISVTISLSKGDTQGIRIVSVLACILYIIYDIYVKAYIGAIAASIEGIIALIAFIKNNKENL